MKLGRRTITEDEARTRLTTYSIFARTRRREAELERAEGQVETLEFRVVRAWNLNTCVGPPCCANSWLVEADSGEIVHLDSWTLLGADDWRFPGSDVIVVRLPLTLRLVSATASGPCVEAPLFSEVSEESLDDFEECEIIPPARVPAVCRRSGGG